MQKDLAMSRTIHVNAWSFNYCIGPDEFSHSDLHQIIKNRLLNFLQILKVSWLLFKFGSIILHTLTAFTIMQKPGF